jgi:hypothetical protein
MIPVLHSPHHGEPHPRRWIGCRVRPCCRTEFRWSRDWKTPDNLAALTFRHQHLVERIRMPIPVILLFPALQSPPRGESRRRRRIGHRAKSRWSRDCRAKSRSSRNWKIPDNLAALTFHLQCLAERNPTPIPVIRYLQQPSSRGPCASGYGAVASPADAPPTSKSAESQVSQPAQRSSAEGRSV